MFLDTLHLAISGLLTEVRRGILTRDLEAVLDFIYHGETNIFQADLERFLAIAEELQLKGLSHLNEGLSGIDVGLFSANEGLFGNHEILSGMNEGLLGKNEGNPDIDEEIALDTSEPANDQCQLCTPKTLR